MANKPLHIISLGAGVQSSTMALMAANGEIEPMPDAAIFADTGNEPVAVYQFLEWLKPQLPFPVYTVSQGNIYDESLSGLETGERRDWPPFFTVHGGPIFRKCTSYYKVRPLRNKQRELAGISNKKCDELRVISWQGISTDEIQRARQSNEKWCEWRYPLIEQRMTRADCLAWMQRNGYPEPPRSACIICPYHSDAEWQRIKTNPLEWQKAVNLDRRLRRAGIEGVHQQLSLHRSGAPLDEVEFTNETQTDLFGECEGMCGL